ncbi:MAG: DNA topoisomerase [Hymenobacter sp.]
MESSVYDIITRRFIAAFYPDCEVSNTTVLAEAADYLFRVRGRQILSPGWRVVYGDPTQQTAPKPTPPRRGQRHRSRGERRRSKHGITQLHEGRKRPAPAAPGKQNDPAAQGLHRGQPAARHGNGRPQH